MSFKKYVKKFDLNGFILHKNTRHFNALAIS